MKSLSIGVACYPTFGGSGIVATEVGLAMARRGHRVHFICTDVPRRLPLGTDNVWFHPVRAREYPVFQHPPHELALASTMISVAQRHGLDLLHAHYAIPHAAAAWMAREVLGGTVRVVSTLHGTDITLVGSDESYLPITRHSIVQSDAVTVPSVFLRRETHARFELDEKSVPIEVIPNFVDTATWRPLQGHARPRLQALFGPGAGSDALPVLVHVSNFRPVKRVDAVVDVFARVAAQRPALLLLVGEGPTRPEVERQLKQRGLWERARLLGNLEQVADLLRECTVFLLPSETESFGLAALEALASGVPVVASRVGGLPEVIRDGETGWLVPGRDPAEMAERVLSLLEQPSRRAAMAIAARLDVMERFRIEPMVARYETLYEQVLGQRRRVGSPGLE